MAPDPRQAASHSGGEPPCPDFPRAELEQRWERVRAAMSASGLDALLIASEPNYRYLGGHASQAWLIRARPLTLVLPLKGDPFFVVPSSEASGIRASSPIADIRVYRTLVQPGLAELEAGLRERGLATATIGCELGQAQRLGLPYLDFLALQERLSTARFIDAGPLMASLRSIKSPLEIERLRQAARITAGAVEDVLARARGGWTERDIYAALAQGVLARGAERPGYMPVNADTHAPDSTTGGPTDGPLLPGRMVYMGAGCIYRGYWSDAVRCFTVGAASDHQRRMYALIRQAMARCLAVMRPGVAVAEVMRQSLAVFEAAGADRHVGRAGRIGHGTGLELSEPPSLALDDAAILAPGMVLYIEPNCQTEEGNFMIEETVVITQEGPERLAAPAPEELPILPS